MSKFFDILDIRQRHTATQPLTQAPATSTGFRAPSLPTNSNHSSHNNATNKQPLTTNVIYSHSIQEPMWYMAWHTVHI